MEYSRPRPAIARSEDGLTLFLLLSLMSATSASANEKNIARLCPDLHALTRAVNKCKLNPFFTKASTICLRKLGDEIKLQTAALTSAMAAANAASTSAQADKLANHGENLASSRASLEALRAAATQVRDKLLGYRDNMRRAGDVSKDLSKRLSPGFNSILESFPCYRDNHAAITRYITATEAKIAELNGTLGDVSSLKARTDESTKQVGTDSASGLVKANGRAGTGAQVRAPASRKPGSSITGLKEDARKRAKKP